MRIRVEHENGDVETITLTGEWRITEGKSLNRITDSRGFEHFFTLSGHYDGWGAGVNETPATATEIAQALEQKRRLEKITD